MAGIKDRFSTGSAKKKTTDDESNFFKKNPFKLKIYICKDIFAKNHI